MRKAVSDPLARFDPEISLDISYDSPPVMMRPTPMAAEKAMEAAKPKMDTPGGAGDAVDAAPALPLPSSTASSTPSACDEFALARDIIQCMLS